MNVSVYDSWYFKKSKYKLVLSLMSHLSNHCLLLILETIPEAVNILMEVIEITTILTKVCSLLYV